MQCTIATVFIFAFLAVLSTFSIANGNMDNANGDATLKTNDVINDDDVTSLLTSLGAVPVRIRRATKHCDVDCSRVKQRPACATDRQIYRHKCELKRIRRCEGRRLRAIPMGFCTGHFEHTRESKCLQKRRLALSQPLHTAISSYIPQCTPEGAFQDVQCHIETGYCWCVTSDGDPIPGSSRHDADISDVTCRKSNKVCTPKDRAEFNENLMQSFITEYQMTSQSRAQTSRRTIALWKFNRLDANFDELLSRKEIRVLKHLVKKIVRPKPCAKTFDLYCDLDGDSKVTFTEWTLCLGIINKPIRGNQHLGHLGNSNINPSLSNYDVTDTKMTSLDNNAALEEDYDVMDAHSPSLLDYVESSESLDTDFGQQPFLLESEPEALDCLSERQVALELDKLEPEGHVFIPECLATGQYAPAQCHTSTGYCWCVDDVTGRPIPGTSAHDVIPDCDNTSRRKPRTHPDEGTKFLTFPVPT